MSSLAELPRPRRTSGPRELLEGGARVHSPSGQTEALADSSPSELTAALRLAAQELGLARLGVTSLEPLVEDEGHVLAWLQGGAAADMDYLKAGGSAESSPRAHPRSLLPEGKSAVVVALSYPSPLGPTSAAAGEDAPGLAGIVAAYARGTDYHHVLKDRLLLLADALADLLGRPIKARACVDTAPLLERALAVRAGLGFVAKNTMVLSPGVGSFFVLGELFVDVELEHHTAPVLAEGCGRCRACLDACPTDAFDAPYQLDARKCVSYLTIELGGAVPRDLRAGLGDRVFGCDICQTVCPYNQTAHKKPSDPEFTPRAHLRVIDLEKLLFLSSAGYRTLIRGTSLKRTHRAQLCRNAAIALGNSGDRAAVPALLRALSAHPLPLARSHAAWALGRLAFDFGHAEAETGLRAASDHPDEEVRAEIDRWLAR